MAEKPIFFKEQEIKRINETMALCERVNQTVMSTGWKDIIEPLIDKTITDITGCKLSNGRWHGGLLDRARKDERREYYIGYKQALIDLHRRIYGYVDNIPRLKDQRDEIIKVGGGRSSVPLVDDSRYSHGLEDM